MIFLNRILSLGVRPTPVKVFRVIDVLCDHSVSQYPTRGVSEMLQLKYLLSTSISTLLIAIVCCFPYNFYFSG